MRDQDDVERLIFGPQPRLGKAAPHMHLHVQTSCTQSSPRAQRKPQKRQGYLFYALLYVRRSKEAPRGLRLESR